jgi:ribonucleoside-diphosphate reductase alpha chain
MHTGEPYIHFIDTSNRMMPQFLKDKGLKIHQSNLCSEIILPTNEERTAVCCLSSLNSGEI